jgi:NAD-dependent dihydropyrimidine dehydrogenase PreA subunit
MAYVITRPCIDCLDRACVDACPVDCIYEPNEGSSLPKQLVIHPDDCIDCGCCEPVCPVDAIFVENDVPSVFEEDTALNALSARSPKEFHVAASVLRARRPDGPRGNVPGR